MRSYSASTRSSDRRQKIVPAECGLPAVSLGFLTPDDTPVIWRGPMLHGAVTQFFRDVRWTGVDYLIVDMPPAGDIALSLSQSVPVAGAVVDHAAVGVDRGHTARRADVSQTNIRSRAHRI
jgi:Mrp family chromosome partitioning ATPase